MTTSVSETVKRVLWDPGALRMVADAIAVIRSIDDIDAFQNAVRNGDYERAMEMSELSEEEFNEKVNRIRASAGRVRDEHEGFSELSREDIEQIEDP